MPERPIFAILRPKEGPPTAHCDRWLPLAWSRLHGYRPVPYAMMLAWHAAHLADGTVVVDTDTPPDSDDAASVELALLPITISEYVA